MAVIHGPGYRDLPALHEFLLARGWSVSQSAQLDGNGRPDAESGWDYRPSFGGVEMNDVDTATPGGLWCCYSLEEADQVDLVVSSAGNYDNSGRVACEAHEVHEWRAPIDEADDEVDLDELAEVLDKLEAQARAMDPRELIECLFFGPCGRK